MRTLAGAHDKLAEARFFLDLLVRIENGQPLTTESCDSEATYFTSALLNACYSVLEHLKKQGINALRAATRDELIAQLKDEVANILRKNPDLYRRERGVEMKGFGLRSLSVHHKTVDIKPQARSGGYGSARYGTRRCGAGGSGCHLYVDDPFSGKPVLIVFRMTKHVRELEKLVKRWGNSID